MLNYKSFFMNKNNLTCISVVTILTAGLFFVSIGVFQWTGLAMIMGESAYDAGLSEDISPDQKEHALQELMDVLDYPLDENAGVPRIELSKLPDAYTDINDTKQRKSLFLRLLLPLVLLENEKLEEVRDQMNMLLERIESGEELRKHQIDRLIDLAQQYDVDGDPLTDPLARQLLRRRVDIVPPSLAIAQAATESGWGNSRFAREASNLFGIWTFNDNKGLVPEQRDLNKKHLVRKFDSLRDSVRVYMHTLNTHPAYAELRRMRSELKESGTGLSGTAIADGLVKYSIRGEEYVRLIKEIITINNLESLNSVRLQSA